jgi:hypothetical protein
MSRKIFLDIFYSQFSEFLDQLIKVFPEDSDFPTYKSGLFLLQKTNPILVPDQVVIHVGPFEQTIQARDESFFKEHGFDQYTDDNALDLIIKKMKERWDTLSDNNKKVVWDYTTLLLSLARKCMTPTQTPQ